METAGWAAVAAITGTVLGAVVTAVIQLMRARSEAIKERSGVTEQQRADAILEWQEYIEKVSADLEKHRLLIEEVREKSRQQIDALRERYDNKIEGLITQGAKCQQENADLKSDLRLMQAQLQRLQGVAGDESPATVTPAVVIADIEGIIRDASPPIAPLLQWLPSQLKGQSIEVLVPEELREAHRAGLKRVKDTQIPPTPDRPVVTYALAKDGTKVPVLISMSGWQGATGAWYISAEIKRRTGIARTEDVGFVDNKNGGGGVGAGQGGYTLS